MRRLWLHKEWWSWHGRLRLELGKVDGSGYTHDFHTLLTSILTATTPQACPADQANASGSAEHLKHFLAAPIQVEHSPPSTSAGLLSLPLSPSPDPSHRHSRHPSQSPQTHRHSTPAATSAPATSAPRTLSSANPAMGAVVVLYQSYPAHHPAQHYFVRASSSLRLLSMVAWSHWNQPRMQTRSCSAAKRLVSCRSREVADYPGIASVRRL